ncbi:MAG: alpha/beta hydrolase fold domain-containing protein [Candidatus Ornithomonoglobus sp.]
MKLKAAFSVGLLSACIMTVCSTVFASDTDITFNDKPNPNIQQTISLWTEDNIPAKTVWTNSNPNGDPEDFMPNIVSVPAAQNTKIKGAVMINPGGAFSYRSYSEGIPVAQELSKLGYQCFVVNYRLRPYTQEEAALDLARGIRYVRHHADDYGIKPDNIAVMGFSAGGILSGELALNFKGMVNGTVLDSDYVPDALDNVSADATAVGLMYSFYGRLSVASLDTEKFRASNLPPTYVLYGSEEVFRNQIENQLEVLNEAGVTVESHILEGYQHGFGARGNWFGDYDAFLSSVFDTAADDTELLNVEQPVTEGGCLKFSMTANKDITDINIITALYDNGILTAVRVNALNGEFYMDEDKSYMLKIFAWRKCSMQPLMQTKTFYDLKAEQSGEMQEFLNNTLQGSDGTIHYTYYLPSDYDESRSYPMLMTLPGWSSKFNTIEATPLTENSYAKSNVDTWTGLAGDMIVVSPSLTDWGEKSARQTIELTEYFTENFAVDTKRIYAAGFSAGGETMSRAIDERPDLFAAYLHCASQWDGGYTRVAENKIPVYIGMAQNDEYYGAETAQRAYDGLKQEYENMGLSKQEIDNLLVLDLKENSYFNGQTSNYHSGGYYIANDKEIVRWLLEHTRQ